MVTIALKRKSSGKAGGGKYPEPVPDGKYRVKVMTAQEASEVFEDDKYGGLVLGLMILQGDYANRTLDRIRVFPSSEAIRSLVETLGGDSEDEEAELDLDELVNQELNVYLGIKTIKSGATFNQVKRFAPAPRK